MKSLAVLALLMSGALATCCTTAGAELGSVTTECSDKIPGCLPMFFKDDGIVQMAPMRMYNPPPGSTATVISTDPIIVEVTPDPKPVEIEWGPCQTWEGEAASTATTKVIRGNQPEEIRKQLQAMQFEMPKPMPWEFPEMPDREVNCIRQLGFGSDGHVFWRDPRK